MTLSVGILNPVGTAMLPNLVLAAAEANGANRSLQPLYIHGMGHFHLENVIDNKFLEDLGIRTNDEWIMDRVGIRTRRTVLPLDYIRTTKNAEVSAGDEATLYSNKDTGRMAGKMALARAGLTPADIGMVIAGGCCPTMNIPADACLIAAALGIEAPALDINSACSSFGAQLYLLMRMMDLPPYVLVVNPENTTRVVDYSDRATAVLWGDGTSAAVVSTNVPARVRMVESTFNSKPSQWNAVTISKFGHFKQDGGAVQRFAIKRTTEILTGILPGALEYVNGTGGTIRMIAHQANFSMLKTVARRMGKLSDLHNLDHWHNVEDYGNTGAAGAPTVLSQRWDELEDGDAVILAVVGSGLSWASLLLEIDPHFP